MSDVELNDRRLRQLIKALGTNVPTARVGVLAGAGKRKEDGSSTNAEIGAAHEFGTTKLPQRSFLRIPLNDNLQRSLDKAGAFDEQALNEVVRSGTALAWVKKVSITALAIVKEGFATGGYGKWRRSNMKNKTVHLTLVETQQLRESITEEVK